jgi:phage nucleotide-binding protein
MTELSEEIQKLRESLGVEPPKSVDALKILEFGQTGAGKTHFLGTAADSPLTSPVLIIDVEGGTTTLHDKPTIDVVQVRTMKQIQNLADELHKRPKYYKTVGLDGITELQQLDMREVMQAQYEAKPETTDLYVPSPREWGKSGSRVKEILRYLKDLPCHVIVTALQREEQLNNGTIKFVPDIPGQLKSQLPGFFDIVGYLRAVDSKVEGEIIRTMQFAQSPRVVAKDRTRALPPLLEDPTVPGMWAFITDSPQPVEIDRSVEPALKVVAKDDSVVASLKEEIIPESRKA